MVTIRQFWLAVVVLAALALVSYSADKTTPGAKDAGQPATTEPQFKTEKAQAAQALYKTRLDDAQKELLRKQLDAKKKYVIDLKQAQSVAMAVKNADEAAAINDEVKLIEAEIKALEEPPAKPTTTEDKKPKPKPRTPTTKK